MLHRNQIAREGCLYYIAQCGECTAFSAAIMFVRSAARAARSLAAIPRVAAAANVGRIAATSALRHSASAPVRYARRLFGAKVRSNSA